MAQNLISGDIIRISAWCTDGSQASVNVFHYFVSSVGASPITDTDVAQAADLAWAGLYKPILANLATYKGVVAQRIWPPPMYVAVQATAGAGIGTAGAGQSPLQVAGLTSWYTLKAKQAGRGRTYWPFVSSTDVSVSGAPVAGYVTRIGTLASAVANLSSISSSGRTGIIRFGIYNRATHGFEFVVIRTDRSVFATQRRRGAYGRLNSSPI